MNYFTSLSYSRFMQEPSNPNVSITYKTILACVNNKLHATKLKNEFFYAKESLCLVLFCCCLADRTIMLHLFLASIILIFSPSAPRHHQWIFLFSLNLLHCFFILHPSISPSFPSSCYCYPFP